MNTFRTYPDKIDQYIESIEDATELDRLKAKALNNLELLMLRGIKLSGQDWLLKCNPRKVRLLMELIYETENGYQAMKAAVETEPAPMRMPYVENMQELDFEN